MEKHLLTGYARWLATLLPASALLAATALPGDLYAQNYPTRPVRLIVPFAPGGGVDFMGRIIGQRLTEALGQAFVVDNRSGSGGMQGGEMGARATPDGYTLLMGNNSTHGVAQSIDPKNTPYDTIRDFAPITQIASAPHLLLGSMQMPAKTVKEFIDLTKAKPGQLNYGSSGKGSQTQMSMELFKFVTKTNIVEIPYKGVGPSFTALIAGEIQVMFASTTGAMPHVKAGRLRSLGITSEKRSQLVPDMPTLGEQGVPGFEKGPWYALLAPARTPPAIIALLNREVVKIVRMPDIQEKFAQQGAEPVGGTAEELGKVVQQELAKWTKLVKDTGISAN